LDKYVFGLFKKRLMAIREGLQDVNRDRHAQARSVVISAAYAAIEQAVNNRKAVRLSFRDAGMVPLHLTLIASKMYPPQVATAPRSPYAKNIEGSFLEALEKRHAPKGKKTARGQAEVRPNKSYTSIELRQLGEKREAESMLTKFMCV
jgi:hypothetical protein